MINKAQTTNAFTSANNNKMENKKILFHGSPNFELTPVFGKGEDKYYYDKGLIVSNRL